MLGFHKQMDNRIKLLDEILSFRMQGVEFDNGAMYVDGHEAASDVREELVSVTEKLMDELAQCYNVLPQLDINNPIDHRPDFFFNDTATTEIYTLSLHDALPPAQCTLEVLRHRQGQVLAPGWRHYLNADGETLRRRPTPHHRAGPSGRVIGLGVAERLEGLRIPGAPMRQGHLGVDRADQDVMLLPEREHGPAQPVQLLR